MLEETFLNYSVDNNILGINNYNLPVFRMDRDDGSGRRGGGGLCVYARDKYTVSHIVDWNLCIPDIEIMWVCLELQDTRKTYLANIYRPPSGNIKNFLELVELQVINIHMNGNPDIVILGDANIDMAKRGGDVKKYRALLNTLHLTQIIKNYTRLTDMTQTIIDHIGVNRTEMYYSSGTIELGISDHNLIYTVRKKYKEETDTSYIWTRSYHKYDKDLFRRDIERTCWDFILNITTLDLAIDKCMNTLTKVFDKYAPYKWIKCKGQQAKWVTNEFLGLIDAREYHMKKCRKTSSIVNKQNKQHVIRAGCRGNILTRP